MKIIYDIIILVRSHAKSKSGGVGCVSLGRPGRKWRPSDLISMKLLVANHEKTKWKTGDNTGENDNFWKSVVPSCPSQEGILGKFWNLQPTFFAIHRSKIREKTINYETETLLEQKFWEWNIHLWCFLSAAWVIWEVRGQNCYKTVIFISKIPRKYWRNRHHHHQYEERQYLWMGE